MKKGFRRELRNQYSWPNKTETDDSILAQPPSATGLEVEKKTAEHPCYSPAAARNYARLHLSVAPLCNLSCNYCLRDYDCPNESRPGVSSGLLSPEEALEHFLVVKKDRPDLRVVGIAGPGDALANFKETVKTLSLIREVDSAITFCLSTNGLMLPHCINELAALGVTHLTITINAINPAVGAHIYKYADYLGQRYEGVAAAEILVANQLSGLKLAADLGLVVKVNTVLLKGINDTHVEEVIERVAALGAQISNIMQLIPVKGSTFEGMTPISHIEHQVLRWRCDRHLKQMHHCRQCRADAVGLLDHDQSLNYHRHRPNPSPTSEIGNLKTIPLKIAVASKNGLLVDQHFIQADHFYIYESNGQNIRLLETRPINSTSRGERYGKDGGPALQKPEGLIAKLVETINDCDGVVVMRIGEAPKTHLTKRGIAVISTYETVDKAVRKAITSLGH